MDIFETEELIQRGFEKLDPLIKRYKKDRTDHKAYFEAMELIGELVKQVQDYEQEFSKLKGENLN